MKPGIWIAPYNLKFSQFYQGILRFYQAISYFSHFYEVRSFLGFSGELIKNTKSVPP